jgi:hypothetical protein
MDGVSWLRLNEQDGPPCHEQILFSLQPFHLGVPVLNRCGVEISPILILEAVQNHA